MRILRKIIRYFVILLILLNAYILISGKTYLYKAIYYNFVDIDDYKIFDNRTIAKSEGNQPWAKSVRYNKIIIPETISTKLEEIKSIAFLIVQNDSIIHEQYWGEYNESSLSGSFSMAKSYVSALVGVAIKEGKIKSVDQKVGDFLPEFKEGKKDSITIRHLLMMSSGLEWNESYGNPLSITTEAYYGTNLKSLIDGIEVAGAPGKEWKYLGCDTQILSYILKKATGKRLSDYLAEKIWQPIGCENDALWSLDHEGGDEKAYCCINSNARDFARFGQLYLNGGKWKGQQVIPGDYVEQCGKANQLNYKNGKCNHYGWQWWVFNKTGQTTMYYARGILGQYIMVFPEKNMVLVRLGEKRGEKIDGLHTEEVHLIVDWVTNNF